ncbi:MAG: YnbE family lipoprotein [Candidatus Muproteobacteria bacterium RBG_16_64_11]|uniref:YnbE family lipoprotein n=1 Tax=Candidatus Muproteobacteria bacterium RBG_16_64_11 TaxID=1817758 RepID=A0A1F6TBI0_9PROT|nr:MAG: YnbE family lipoprotein [Candidatus Muproteobacteria bacterium RBG_16_64_11]
MTTRPGAGFILAVLAAAYLLVACTPVVRVDVSDKPITINLNVKIEHEIRVKVEKDLEGVFTKDSGLF